MPTPIASPIVDRKSRRWRTGPSRALPVEAFTLRARGPRGSASDRWPL